MEKYTYLCTALENKLSFDATDTIYAKAHEHMHLYWKLRGVLM